MIPDDLVSETGSTKRINQVPTHFFPLRNTL